MQGSNRLAQPWPKPLLAYRSPLQVVGQPVTRIDARVKVTGEAQFSADRMPADGLLYGKTLRSPHPHAEIIRIDTAKADGLPGVRAVVTFRDAPENPFEDGDDSVTDEPLAPVYLLNRIVRHVGDEVAAVAADSEEIAEEALRLIEVEYRTLPVRARCRVCIGLRRTFDSRRHESRRQRADSFDTRRCRSRHVGSGSNR